MATGRARAKRGKRTSSSKFDPTKEILEIFASGDPAKLGKIYRFYSHSSAPFVRATKLLEAKDGLVSQGVDAATATEAAALKMALRGTVNRWMLSAWAAKHDFTIPVIDTVGSWIRLSEKYGVDPEAKTLPAAKSKLAGIFRPIKVKKAEDKKAPDKKEEHDVSEDSEVKEQKTRGWCVVRVAFLEQMPNIKNSPFLGPEHPIPDKFDMEAFTGWVKSACDRCGVTMKPGMIGKPAAFSPGTGELIIPEPRGFSDIHEWACGIIHELSHAGHFQLEPEAFSKNPKADSPFKSLTAEERHAYLEVIAEFSAGVGMYELGIRSDKQMNNSAAYVAGYAKRLDTPHGQALFSAALEMSDKVMEGVLGPQVTRQFDIERYMAARNGESISKEGQRQLEEAGIPISSLSSKERGQRVLNYLSESLSEPKPENPEQKLSIGSAPGI